MAESEAQVRELVRRRLQLAGWHPDDIVEEDPVDSGRIDIRLGTLAILELKRQSPESGEDLLLMHLQQAQRYARHQPDIPFLRSFNQLLD